MENTHHSGFFCFAQKFETGLSFSVKNPDFPDMTGFFLDKVCTVLLQYNP